METQIFISNEQRELIYDNDQLSEFSNLVSELGLKCANVRDASKSPIPYMWMDEATIRAFKILCPFVQKIEDYDKEIPLEILRAVKLSSTESYFDSIEIWSNERDPDPFCVGRVYKNELDRTKGYTWNMESYLIGRWGAESKSIQELINFAIEIASRRISDHAQATISKMTSWKQCPEVWARQFIFHNNSEVFSAIIHNGTIAF